MTAYKLFLKTASVASLLLLGIGWWAWANYGGGLLLALLVVISFVCFGNLGCALIEWRRHRQRVRQRRQEIIDLLGHPPVGELMRLGRPSWPRRTLRAVREFALLILVCSWRDHRKLPGFDGGFKPCSRCGR